MRNNQIFAEHQLLSDAHLHSVAHPPTSPRRPALVFPVSPGGCESGHLYSKSTLLCGEKHRCTQNTGASGTHFPRVEQLWPKLLCFAVGSQRNAGRTALRAPTEGKLQGSAACRNSDENTGACLEVYDISLLAGGVVQM